LSNNFPALVIYDKFKAQYTDAVIKVLRENNIHIATDGKCLLYRQPLDVSVNKAAKEFMRKKFQN